MLVYIDESGNPHPKDNNLRPTIAALCVAEDEHRKINRQLYAIKRKFLDDPNEELKAKKLLRPYVFENDPKRRELVERVFELLGQAESLAIFAIIMERPQNLPTCPDGFLPVQFCSLLERLILYVSDIYGYV